MINWNTKICIWDKILEEWAIKSTGEEYGRVLSREGHLSKIDFNPGWYFEL